ncbi:MAG: hypothetical protein E6Q97_29710 [Desulfurellales bacterium]|nr:MAG: hypothetical protein E6Q97_29710 [Desulfurellales bacterium]
MIDTMLVEQARSVNLVSLAGQRVELRKESATEWSGPCPLCGGHDRLHVKATGFFCRNRSCWSAGADKFGDPIDYARWLYRVDFAGAVSILTGQSVQPEVRPATPRPSTATQAKPKQYDGWADQVGGMVATAQERLESAAGYLANRGLEMTTAVAYRLGFRTDAPLPGTWNSRERRHVVEPQPAIVLPWYRAGKLVAVRYRFLSSSTYTDVDGKERTVKLSSVHGSDFAGALYGGHVLPEFCTLPPNEHGRNVEGLRTLVLCEGEINAMSIWQTTQRWNWDVLSLGSESQKLTAGAIEFAERYGRVIVWMDQPEFAKRVMAQIAGAVAVNSPVVDGKKVDANDMLRTGQLAEFLIEARLHEGSVHSEEEKEMLNWWLQEVLA